MKSVSHFVGLDYHQKFLQVCVMDEHARVKLNRRCDNDLASLLPLLGRAGAVKKIAIEACEGAADLGEALAQAGDWSVELAHPLYVSKLKGSPDKSDLGDAKLLADLSRVGYLPRVWLAPQPVRELRQLVNHRQRLADQRRSIKQRVTAVLRNHRVRIDGSRWTRTWVEVARAHPALPQMARWLMEELLDELAWVLKRLNRVERRLREATQDDPIVRRLMAIEGVGEVTAWALRAAIGRFDRFKSAKQLCRYCGLSPRNTASGERQTQGGLVQAADRRLRALLIQAAHRLIRTQPRWRALSERMIQKGKPKTVAVAAVANRWLRTVHQRMIQPAA